MSRVRRPSFVVMLAATAIVVAGLGIITGAFDRESESYADFLAEKSRAGQILARAAEAHSSLVYYEFTEIYDKRSRVSRFETYFTGHGARFGSQMFVKRGMAGEIGAQYGNQCPPYSQSTRDAFQRIDNSRLAYRCHDGPSEFVFANNRDLYVAPDFRGPWVKDKSNRFGMEHKNPDDIVWSALTVLNSPSITGIAVTDGQFKGVEVFVITVTMQTENCCSEGANWDLAISISKSDHYTRQVSSNWKAGGVECSKTGFICPSTSLRLPTSVTRTLEIFGHSQDEQSGALDLFPEILPKYGLYDRYNQLLQTETVEYLPGVRAQLYDRDKWNITIESATGNSESGIVAVVNWAASNSESISFDSDDNTIAWIAQSDHLAPKDNASLIILTRIFEDKWQLSSILPILPDASAGLYRARAISVSDHLIVLGFPTAVASVCPDGTANWPDERPECDLVASGAVRLIPNSDGDWATHEGAVDIFPPMPRDGGYFGYRVAASDDGVFVAERPWLHGYSLHGTDWNSAFNAFTLDRFPYIRDLAADGIHAVFVVETPEEQTIYDPGYVGVLERPVGGWDKDLALITITPLAHNGSNLRAAVDVHGGNVLAGFYASDEEVQYAELFGKTDGQWRSRLRLEAPKAGTGHCLGFRFGFDVLVNAAGFLVDTGRECTYWYESIGDEYSPRPNVGAFDYRRPGESIVTTNTLIGLSGDTALIGTEVKPGIVSGPIEFLRIGNSADLTVTVDSRDWSPLDLTSAEVEFSVVVSNTGLAPASGVQLTFAIGDMLGAQPFDHVAVPLGCVRAGHFRCSIDQLQPGDQSQFDFRFVMKSDLRLGVISRTAIRSESPELNLDDNSSLDLMLRLPKKRQFEAG